MRTLQGWYESPLGRTLAEAERDLLDRYLDRYTGARLLQIGGFGDGRRVRRANTSRQWLVDLPGQGPVDCRLRPEQLPFQSDTMDIVVLVHRLEFSPNPHRLLREAARVLSPEGHLLVLCFNLMSLWGAAHLWPGLRRRGAPWDGEYFSGRRLRDWLTLLELEVKTTERGFYRPPLNRPRLLERLERLETWGHRILPWLGGVQLIVAQKHVAGLTPLRPVWRPRPKLIPGGLAQPTSRVC